MEFFNCCVIHQVTTLKRKRATDLRLQKYGRNAKESFSLPFNLSTFSTNLSFYILFPRCFQTDNNWGVHCMRSATNQSTRGLFQLHRVMKSKKQYSDKKRNTDLDIYFSYYKVRFPGALLAQNSHCHQKQGLDWYSSSLVTSRRPHMIWSTVSTRTKDQNFHWLVSL